MVVYDNGSTKIIQETDGTFTIDSPIHIERGFLFFDEAFKCMTSFR